ncbi:hypothetical protein FD30_GL001550 [Levilactobacillus namurensis DSM 19117]|uniref:HTH merR-type domain-containing protein n=1 Tax=Levilactobacillus namurensis DSM 19117 TaxID=1423773 RepID=A0A0R1JY82_9LACO|nr:hypothetical protein FD30_GL001550 [Levilactobacillus namurensis DSM 19117]GEO74619.1 hypothetical protein LNA02_13170 [Levilactobacillus namurensis]
MADKTGLSAYTLRYYDHEGLMPFVQRTAAGPALKDIRHVVEPVLFKAQRDRVDT